MSPPIVRSVTIDSAGRIVLPIEVRRLLNLSAGSRLRLDVEAGRIELTPEVETDPVFGVSATNRVVLRPTGRVFDAMAATHAERIVQVNRSKR